MVLHEMALTGGTVVDGSGSPPFRADVAIDAGVISAVAENVGPAREIIDVHGCIVTPGFIDPHTHLDMQLLWDATASPSCRHGVTTVTLSACGFGIAPSHPDDQEYLLRSLEVVEEIPYGCSSIVQPFEWTTWDEYMEVVDAQELGVNVASFVPHSALRQFVMRDRSTSERATVDERLEMRKVLEGALEAGAVGFSTSRGPNHNDAHGVPVPSRSADDDELRCLVDAVAGRVWQPNLENKLAKTAELMIAEVDRYAAWTAQAGASLSWTPLVAVRNQTSWRDALQHSGRLRESGVNVRPQILPLPITVELTFDPPGPYLNHFTGWASLFDGFERLTASERTSRLRDPAWRRLLIESSPEEKRVDFDLDDWTIISSPSAPEAVGTAVSTLSVTAPLDELLDILVADAFQTVIQAGIANQDADAVDELLRDDTTLLGLGDSGAHVTSLTSYAYPTYLLETIVRERGVLTLAAAVRRLTSDPASVLGLQDRGQLRPGFGADVCAIDLDLLSLSKPELRNDLPRGYARLVQEATGYRAVLVNGVRTLIDDRVVAQGAGRVLRVS